VDDDLIAAFGPLVAGALGEDLLGHAAVLGGGDVGLLVNVEIGVLDFVIVEAVHAAHGHAVVGVHHVVRVVVAVHRVGDLSELVDSMCSICRCVRAPVRFPMERSARSKDLLFP